MVKNIKIIIIMFFLISFNLSASDFIEYKTQDNSMTISINKNDYNAYKKNYSSIIENIKKCSKGVYKTLNPLHLSRSLFSISGDKQNCSITIINNDLQKYECENFEKKDLDEFLNTRISYLKDVKNIETFSDKEQELLNKNCKITFLKSAVTIKSN